MYRIQKHIRLIVFLLPLFFYSYSSGQVSEYYMPKNKDTTITTCKGRLYDSEGPFGVYKPNERDTLRICTGGTITLSFSAFSLECPFGDTLAIYSGSTIGAGTLVGKYTCTNIPPSITSTNGCIILIFSSDIALQTQGWTANWTSTIVPPVPPTISALPIPSCNTSTVTVGFSYAIPCDSVYAGAFRITGPLNYSVTAASPIACNGSNQTTTSAQITVNYPLDQNCNYLAHFRYKMLDNCDSLWTFNMSSPFTITDCPVATTFSVSPNDTICSGSCTQIEAILNSCLAYNYYWSHGLPNSPNQTVCPNITTTYTLGVQSTAGGPIYTSSITIAAIDPQITPLANSSICQSVPAFTLTAFPPGGTWSGEGIIDPVAGIYFPDSATPGTHYVVYSIGGLCKDSIPITIKEIKAGFDDAACPGSAPFLLSAFAPIGGTWSGSPLVSAGGIFNPTSVGTYSLTYTHPNGCSDQKNVFVSGLTISANTDTICQSVNSYSLQVSPPGGRWLPTPGLIDTVNGIINPDAAGPGIHSYTYRLNGCSGIANIFIKPMDMNSGNINACPSQTLITLPLPSPSGGLWSSHWASGTGQSGIVNASTGDYNPSVQGAGFSESLVYNAPNGCSDTISIWVVGTTVVNTNRFFCSGDDSIAIRWPIVDHYPYGGVWTGNGIVGQQNPYYFHPSLVAPGVHTLTYSKNTCSDTIQMIVFPDRIEMNDTTICTTNPFSIMPTPAGAFWQGEGITNNSTGTFDPGLSGLGTFSVTYTSPSGCSDTVNITVLSSLPANVGGFVSQYCFEDAMYDITTTPSGGILTINGVVIDSTSFNPSQLGPGTHEVIYSYGTTNGCIRTDTASFVVFMPLQTNVYISEDSLCLGKSSVINVTTSGGVPNIIPTLSWNQGLQPINTNWVSPSATTWYTITTSDGCSIEKIDSIQIYVHPPFTTAITTSSTVCYGLNGTATATVAGPNTYSYIWSSTPNQTTAAVTALAGLTYQLHIKDDESNCTFDTAVKIPSYGQIKSLTSPNPNYTCIPFEQNTVKFLDLSIGATGGYWYLGIGDTIPYVPGQTPEMYYPEPGNYSVVLHVYNEGNCEDEFIYDLCIDVSKQIFVPEVFSPNGDGLNDILYVRGKAIEELLFIVYDRWGEKVFETTSNTVGWDGNYKGSKVPPGVFVWYLDAKLNDGKKINQKGDISLIR